MTSQRPRPTSKRAEARRSVADTRKAVQELREAGDESIDPASALFFEFAGPLLVDTRNEQEFATAAAIAEFVWTATFFDAAAQAELLDQFIDEAGIPEEMVPWLLEIYDELATRKQALLSR